MDADCDGACVQETVMQGLSNYDFRSTYGTQLKENGQKKLNPIWIKLFLKG